MKWHRSETKMKSRDHFLAGLVVIAAATHQALIGRCPLQPATATNYSLSLRPSNISRIGSQGGCIECEK
jgi:hypothetical protein